MAKLLLRVLSCIGEFTPFSIILSPIAMHESQIVSDADKVSKMLLIHMTPSLDC